LNVLFRAGLRDQLFGQFGAFTIRHHPANDIATKGNIGYSSCRWGMASRPIRIFVSVNDRKVINEVPAPRCTLCECS
jgi:hypothetical protein